MADGITIRAENLQFDGREFSEAMNQELESLFHEAARAFLIASTRRIPIRTGFLRGAFTRLEDVVGAFEASSSNAKARGLAKPRQAERPGKDLATAANKVVRLRAKQNRLLKQIRRLQQREATRRKKFTEQLAHLDEILKANREGNRGLPSNKQTHLNRETELRKLLASNRATAIRQRVMVQSLIKQAQANEGNIQRAVQRFREKIGGTLRSEANDVSRSLRLRDAVLQQKRNEAFQKDIKRLHQSFFGRKDKTPGKFAGRLPGTLDQQTFDKRLNRLRDKIGRPSKVQQRIRARIKDIQGNFITKVQQSRLENYARTLAKKYGDRIREAQHRDEDELEKDLRSQLAKKLQTARKKIINTNREDHPLLAVAQRRLARQQRVDAFHLERLRQQLQATGDNLNVTARTTRGRIVGQNSPGKFNLVGGERVKKIFNQRDKSGKVTNEFQEYYYPTKGTPEAKILKTPRSGRRFATPANAIIVKFSNAPAPNLQLFQQLAGFVKASGGNVRADVARAAQDTTKTVTRYEFHFAVDIRYLAVNDARLAWESWFAGVNAFSYVINSKAPGRLPKLSDFQYVVTRQLRPGQSRTISGRK